MPPRLTLRSVAGRSRSLRDAIAAPKPSVCLFCSLSPSNGSRRVKRRTATTTTTTTPATRRNQSTVTPTATSTPTPTSARPSNPRAELVHALHDLERHAAQYVNLSRLQLALDSLGQPAGDEPVRVAVYGSATAKEVLRLLLADPLSAKQEWEDQLAGHDISTPLIIRVGTDQQRYTAGGEETNLTFTRGQDLKELHVSSPGLNGHRLEILLLKDDQLTGISQDGGQDLETVVLMPEVNIPTSGTSHSSPVVTPVHKALLVTDGIAGIASLSKLLSSPSHQIFGAADLPGYAPEKYSDLFPLPIDVKPADEGVAAFRQSIGKGIEYEKLWFRSRLPTLLTWLKEGSASTDDGTTKETVRALVASVLRNVHRSIAEVEERSVRSGVNSLPAPGRIVTLNKDLEAWSEKAHAELQGELDRAFTSRRWKKLNWWKLFWRVDDVGMLSSEMLSQRFLPRAERNVIYLAGQVEGSGVWYPENGKAVYSLPVPPAILGEKADKTVLEAAAAQPLTPTRARGTKWPTHITFTRNYLQSETIPALQALAQKLVLQSAGFSSVTTSLGALMYLSSFGISESGAVAAFGIVWSLRRLQKKWETAREYWQSEVREEGRKAVRAVEISVGEAIDKAVLRRSSLQDGAKVNQELGEARRLVQRAEDALEKLK